MALRPLLEDAEASVEDLDDDCILLSPPPKRYKVGDTEEGDKEPLCCSTPQRPGIASGEDENGAGDVDLDTTLELLGISRDSVGSLAVNYSSRHL